jgi:2-polyprenyl-3-methyl-5-hydroxy-6-metoxy-1,4-benzoquinol methylase
MTTQPAIDQKQVEAFMGKVMADTSGLMATIMASLGDQLGLFKNLTYGAATSAQLATRTGLNERYTREWLSAMASAGYIAYDPASACFTLPPAHLPVLAQENGPFFCGGIHQFLLGISEQRQGVLQAFQQGGGIPPSAYSTDVWEGMARASTGAFEHLLVPVAIPSMPAVQAHLVRGAQVADVGCGQGWALIKLAQSYPASRYVGYDVIESVLAQATKAAEQAGVADRVRFCCQDVSQGLPETYDLITTFDMVHDTVDPRGLLQVIRQALRPGGRYVCVEPNSSEKLEENAGPLGTIMYSTSVLYCMTISLSNRGEGLGTAGLPESKLRELCRDVGFSSIHHVPLENPMNTLYEIAP